MSYLKRAILFLGKLHLENPEGCQIQGIKTNKQNNWYISIHRHRSHPMPRYHNIEIGYIRLTNTDFVYLSHIYLLRHLCQYPTLKF